MKAAWIDAKDPQLELLPRQFKAVGDPSRTLESQRQALEAVWHDVQRVLAIVWQIGPRAD